MEKKKSYDSLQRKLRRSKLKIENLLSKSDTVLNATSIYNDLMRPAYFERQVGHQCAKHAINNMLQLNFCSIANLNEIADELFLRDAMVFKFLNGDFVS